MSDSGNRLRIGTYAPVSSQEQALEGTSMEYQDEQLNAYCAAQGWIVINS